MSFRRIIAAAALAVAAIAAAPASAAMFSFDFTAPWDNGDTARGSGVLTTDEADSNGFYVVTGGAGTLTAYDGAPAEAITGAGTGFFFFRGPVPVAYVVPDGSGFTTSSLTFFTDSRSVSFYDNGAGFSAYSLETFAPDASLNIAAITAVPEPATWALMIGGFGLVGGTLRARRGHAVALAA